MIKLPFNFLNKSSFDENNYLGLLLKENEGIVYFLKVIDSNPSIVIKERFNYTNGWDNLLEDIDEVLYRLELKGYKSPDSSIFFVYSNLIDKYKKEIKKEYLLKVKELVKNLELKPLGYIEIHDAVIELISSKEGIPITSILIEVDSKSLSIFLYKNNKLLQLEQVEKKQDILESIIPAFERLRLENMLPSRILIYDSKNVDNEVSSLISHSWSKEIFIQHPKVEIINENELTNSLINVFSKQLSSEKPKVEKEPQKKQVMGFTVGQDTPAVSGIDKKYFDRPQKLIAGYISNSKNLLFTLVSKIKSLNYSKNIFIILGLFLIIIAFFGIEYFFHKTEVILTLPSQSIEDTLSIDDIDPEISTKSASFETSKKTTGKKEIGESAKGEVTIHNFDSNEAEFSGGIKLTAENLTFILDTDTKVASASLTSDKKAKIPGQTKAKVTADNIGSEYNLEANKTFKISDLPESDYFAINESAISGGTKKEVKTVSEEDIASLEEDITEKAKVLSEDEIDETFKKKNTIVDQLGGIELSNLVYDKKLGEEAATLGLKAKADIKYFGLNKDEIKKRIAKDLKNQIEKNFVIENENINYSIIQAEDLDGSYEFELDVKAKASEKVDISKIRDIIVRKNIDNITKDVEENYNAKKVELDISHPISFLKNWSSIFKKNIDLKIIYD